MKKGANYLLSSRDELLEHVWDEGEGEVEEAARGRIAQIVHAYNVHCVRATTRLLFAIQLTRNRPERYYIFRVVALRHGVVLL